MNLLQETLDLCKKYKIKPERSKGQNFLINESVYDDIIKTADLKKDNVVLEVGPGLGFLTRQMAAKVKKVIAVEVDSSLASFLKKDISKKNISNIKIFNNDILKARGSNFSKIGKYKIVSNLPYNISSIFLRKFLSLNNKPESIVLMLQKEVAERITATPPDMSLLSCSVQFYADTKIIFNVSKENFFPIPKIDSAVIKITPNKKLLPDFEEEKKFFKLLRMGFSSKRKMLKNNLINGLKLKPEIVVKALKSVSLDEKVRSEQLSINDWLKLYTILKK